MWVDQYSPRAALSWSCQKSGCIAWRKFLSGPEFGFELNFLPISWRKVFVHCQNFTAPIWISQGAFGSDNFKQLLLVEYIRLSNLESYVEDGGTFDCIAVQFAWTQ